MNIIIVTPNEPFYLAENIDYLLQNLSPADSVVGCVLLKPTPYGKRLNFFQKSIRTFQIFGLKFFFYYSIKYLRIKIFSKDVKQILKNNKVPIIQLSKSINNDDSIDILKQYDPDLIISILGNEIFKKPILNLPKKGCLNLHTSHLPKYRGMMPTFWALLHDEKEIGVSVFIMDEGIDTGPIITQELIPIMKNESQKELIQKTKNLGMKLIIDSIEIMKSDNIKLINNDDEKSSYFGYPTNKDVKLFLQKGKKFF